MVRALHASQERARPASAGPGCPAGRSVTTAFVALARRLSPP